MPRYIDADLLMKELGITDTDCEKCQFGCGAFCTKEADFVDACDAICEAPIADVRENIHGKWLVIEDELWEGGGRYECSVCGYGFAFGAFHEMDEQHFCPNCGADMRERRE